MIGGRGARIVSHAEAEARDVVTPSLPLLGIGARLEVAAGRTQFAVALGLVALMVILAALAPALAPYDPSRIDLSRAGLPPGPSHPMGTDRLGRDVLSRWLIGGRTSLAVAAAAAGLGCTLGAIAGALAGYREGWLGGLIDRAIDVALALPIFFIAVALQTALPQGETSVIVVLGATGWMGMARILRGEVLRIKRLAFVEAARALGCSDCRILLRHVVPHCAGAFVATLTACFGEALLLQSTLSFLGLGIPPPAPSWGGALLEAMPEMLHGAWWLILVPGLSILSATAALGVCAECLRRESGWR